MNKFNKVSFEEMLKYEGLIACEHGLLIEELYKKPMNFSTFLTKLVSFYSDFEIKEIFLGCTWYNVIREKARVISLNDYINNGYDNNHEYITKEEMLNKIDSEIYEDLLYGICKSTFNNFDFGTMKVCKKSDDHIDDVIKYEINNIFDGIDEKVKDMIDNNIVELKIPEYDIDKDILEEQIEKYIKLNGSIYIIHNDKIDKLGEILSYNNNKIKVKILDKMISIFKASDKKVELVIHKYLTKEGPTIILETMYIDAGDVQPIDLEDVNISPYTEELKNILDVLEGLYFRK